MNNLAAIREEISKELHTHIVPFWEKHTNDPVHGGHFSCLGCDGAVFDTDKFAWMQGRGIWMFAKLVNEYGDKFGKREQWLSLAKSAVDFVRKHGYADNGDIYFAFKRDGTPLIHPYNIYSDCFMATAYAEYAKAAACDWSREEALRLYKRIQERAARPKGEWTKSTGERSFMAMGFQMIQMTMARDMADVLPPSVVEPVVDKSLDIFWKLHVKRDKKRVFERVQPDGSLNLEVMEGRLLNPGHALETLWMVMDVANERGESRMVADCAEAMLWTIDHGWDKEYGGIYYYQDYLGHPTEQLQHFMKLWWVHAEALCAFLLAYKLTGSQVHYDWFVRIWDYCAKHFSDREYGEWFGYLDREGRPSSTQKGGKWKGFFHLPRALMLCEGWMQSM